MKSGFVLCTVFPENLWQGWRGGRVGSQRRMGTWPVRDSSFQHSQQWLLSENFLKAGPCLLKPGFASLGLLHTPVLVQPAHLLVLFVFQEEMGISCELLESDFLKCSVGFPFMRSKSKVRGRDGALPWQHPRPFPPATHSATASPRFRPHPTAAGWPAKPCLGTASPVHGHLQVCSGGCGHVVLPLDPRDIPQM